MRPEAHLLLYRNAWGEMKSQADITANASEKGIFRQEFNRMTAEPIDLGGMSHEM